MSKSLKIEDDELQNLLISLAARTTAKELESTAKELESTTKELESILQQKQSEPGHSLLENPDRFRALWRD